MNNYKFGKYLKEKRLENNLTYLDVAKKLDCDEEVIKKYETDEYWKPNDDTISKLSDILNVSKEEIFLKAYSLEELLQIKNDYISKLREDNIHIEDLSFGDIDMENLQVYLRPLPREGMFGVMSPVVSINDNYLYNKTECNLCLESEYFSKAWFEIVALMPYEYGDNNHKVIGHLTGYLINTNALDYDIKYNDGMSSFYQFDEVSHILSTFWSDFKSGELNSKIKDKFALGEYLYLLNNISIDEKYISTNLYKNIFKLIPYMFSQQFNIEISHIIFTKDVTELDDEYMNENLETQTGLSEKDELDCLNQIGFSECESLSNYTYMIASCNREFCDLKWKKEW